VIQSVIKAKTGAKLLGESVVLKKTEMISPPCLLENSNETFDQAQKNALESKFVSFRKIAQGNANLPLAVIVRVLDHCLANSKFELFHKLHQALHVYNYLFLDNSQGVLVLMQNIADILYANKEINMKMEEMEEIYNKQGKDLEMVMRNLIKISTKLNYYRKSMTACLELRPIQTLDLAFQDGLFELKDFLLFLISSEIQLKVVDLATLQTMAYGNRPLNYIYLVKTIDGLYYPITTSAEYLKMTFSSQECLEMNEFGQNVNKAEPQVRIEDANRLKAEILDTEENTKMFMAVLKQIYGGLNASNSFDELRELLNDKNMESVLLKFCCGSCLVLQKTAEFPCGHVLCYNCSYKRYDAKYSYCSICSFNAQIETIHKYFQ